MSTVTRYRTRLKEIRERLGLSRMDIVRGANLSYPTVTNWETASLASLEAKKIGPLLDFLGVTHDELVYLVEEEEEAEAS